MGFIGRIFLSYIGACIRYLISRIIFKNNKKFRYFLYEDEYFNRWITAIFFIIIFLIVKFLL
mgnify:CR=1 FL=1